MSRRGFGRRDEAEDDTHGPVLITHAQPSYQEQLAKRKKQYFLLMSVRIPALVLAGIAYMLWENPWITCAIVVATVPIPWIAVILANDAPPRPKGAPRGYAGSRGQFTDSQIALPSSLRGDSER